MPRGGATAYGSHAVCHYAEGGATEAYCSLFVCVSVAGIPRRSLSADTSNTCRNRYFLGTELINF